MLESMVQFTVLASGSKGNSAVLAAGSTRLLLDAGLSARELCRRMHAAGVDSATLDAILVTHEHSDHVRGLGALARRLGIPVYLTEGTHREWRRIVNPPPRQTYSQWIEAMRARRAAASTEESTHEAGCAEANSVATLAASEAIAEANADGGAEEAESNESELGCITSDSDAASATFDPARLPEVHYLRPGEPITLGDFEVHPFTIPHDAADPVAYVFRAEGLRIAVATDLGYIPPNVAAQLQNCDALMLESNHDLDMLRDGPYPWSVKQRVLSRVGHLSNDAASEFLEQSWDGRAACVVLAHLSESNNLPELARVAAERALASHTANLFARKLLLASQHEPLETLRF